MAPGVEVATNLGVGFADVDGDELVGAHGGEVGRDNVSDRRDPVERGVLRRYAPKARERATVAHGTVADYQRSSLHRQLLRREAVDARRRPNLRIPAAKTCPLLASSTASTSPEYERAGAARASRVEFFDSGMPVPAERARAVAAAMRMPVKVPGPTPASTRPTEPRSSPARSRAACMAGSSVSEAPRAVRETSASTSRLFPRAKATVVTGVEASRARISKASDALRPVL